VKCPSCGETIPDDIDICPNCGYLIKYSDKSKRPMMPGKYIGAILVILIIGATLGYYYFYGDNGDYFAPFDADFYISIDGEALSYGSSELPGSLLDELGPDYGPEMEELANNVERMAIFGWEERPEDLVAVIDPINKDDLVLLLEEELSVSSTTDIGGYEFNLVEDGMGYLWKDDLCIIGSQDGIQKSLQVNNGEIDALEEMDSFKDIMENMPDSDMFMYASVMDSEQVMEYEDILAEMPEFARIGAIAIGINPEEGAMTLIMEMGNEEDASSASKKMGLAIAALKSMTGDDVSFEHEIEVVDNYLILSITVEELDLEELMSEGLMDPSGILEGGVI